MKDVLNAFNRHDLDAIMEYFSDDCSFDFPEDLNPGVSVLLVKKTLERDLLCALRAS
jgi:hypothetical protein